MSHLGRIDKAAGIFALIKKTSLELSTCTDIVSTIKKWPSDLRRILRHIFSTKAKPEATVSNATTLFLTSLSDKTLLRIMNMPDTLRLLNLESWQTKDGNSKEATLADTSAFRFIIDEGNQTEGIGQVYRDLRAVLAANDHNRLCCYLDRNTDGLKKFDVRMALILLCYQEYFKEGRAPYRVLTEDLQSKESYVVQCLNIEANELPAFQFVAGGPKDTYKGYIYELFTKMARQKVREYDITTADVMVNCLAISLGSPPGSVHLYDCIFRPIELSQRYCPGGDYERRYMDCSFRMTREGVLTNTVVS